MLLRHSDAASHAVDHERPLTDAGVDAALEAGAQIAQLETLPDVWLVSSAARARQTADLLLRRIPPPRLGVLVERELYLSETPTYVERLQRLPDAALVALVVGHNPTLSQLAERWLGRRVALHPAAWVVATFSLTGWRDLR